MLLPFVGVYVTLTTQSLEALTVPSAGVIAREVPSDTIQFGKAESSVITTDVKDPVVAQESAVQDRMAGVQV